MLNEEAKAALLARLSQSDDAAPAPDETQVDTSETHEPPVSPEPAPEPTQPEPTTPKMVPLEDLVRIRQDRKQVREQLDQERQNRARLEGELAALKQASRQDTWVDEALKEPEDEDPIADVRAELEVIRSERRQNLLTNVINLVKEAEPTLPEARLLKGLARGESPQEIVAEWQGLRSEILKSAPPTVGAQTPATKPNAPPTVPRTVATQSAPKPRTWEEVQKAVRNLK